MAALDERSIFIKTRTQSSMYLETVEDKNESMMLSKASSELEFDIVEFWVTELVDNQVDHSCAYVYYNLSITESFPELTSIRFPISTIAAPFSKKVSSYAIICASVCINIIDSISVAAM